uniref:Ubiquitin-like domain-containing protein n=1 Tax=Athene cunicularia TaxID=194338 RepID=A0A663LWN9_ATHCN
MQFNVFIKTLFGKTFVIPVSLDTSVRELKAKLNAQDPSLLPEMGRLIYGSKQLEDDQTLRYYRVKPESSLYHLRRCK